MTTFDVTYELVKSEEIEAESMDEAEEIAGERLGNWEEGRLVVFYLDDYGGDEPERVGYL